jgi:hypothetical protein
MVGIISIIIGIICINIILASDVRDKYNNIKTYLIFFIVGILIHYIVRSINLDQIYCDKQCRIRASIN